METVEPRTLLSHLDRCDVSECRARAYVLARYEKGVLMFCVHHWNEKGEKASATAYDVIDESWNL